MIGRQSNAFRALAAARDPDVLWPLVDATSAARRARFGIGDPEEALAAASGIVLYGAGDFARAVLESWRGRTIPVRYLVDSHRDKWGRRWQGYSVASPDALARDSDRPLVVVAAMDAHAISLTLDQLDLPYLFAERDGSVGFMPGHLLARRRKACENVFNLLADKRSRFVFLSVVIARMFQDFSFPMRGNLFTDRCASYPQYFPDDVIVLRDGESFVDCGAFDGDSLVGFAAEVFRRGIAAWSATGIEADASNVARARANLAVIGLDDISIHEAVLGTGREGVAALHSHNCLGDRIEGAGNTVALDDLLAEHAPSYIKMDIEGAELAALAGARATIERHRPKLAVCTYHSTRDLIEIPLFLADHFSFYDLYLRHHRGGSLWETVLYALPRSSVGVPHVA